MKPVDYESQELSIHFYPADRNGTARVYTTIPSWMDKLDELCETSSNSYKLVKNDGYGKKYEVSMKKIHFGKDASEEQRARLQALASNLRSSSSQNMDATADNSEE